jgi:hypothetical protein
MRDKSVRDIQCGRNMVDCNEREKRIAEQAAEIARLQEFNQLLLDTQSAVNAEALKLKADNETLREQVARVPVVKGYVNDDFLRRFPSDFGGLNSCRNDHYNNAIYIDPPAV